MAETVGTLAHDALSAKQDILETINILINRYAYDLNDKDREHVAKQAEQFRLDADPIIRELTLNRDYINNIVAEAQIAIADEEKLEGIKHNIEEQYQNALTTSLNTIHGLEADLSISIPDNYPETPTAKINSFITETLKRKIGGSIIGGAKIITRGGTQWVAHGGGIVVTDDLNAQPKPGDILYISRDIKLPTVEQIQYAIRNKNAIPGRYKTTRGEIYIGAGNDKVNKQKQRQDQKEQKQQQRQNQKIQKQQRQDQKQQQRQDQKQKNKNYKYGGEDQIIALINAEIQKLTDQAEKDSILPIVATIVDELGADKMNTLENSIDLLEHQIYDKQQHINTFKHAENIILEKTLKINDLKELIPHLEEDIKETLQQADNYIYELQTSNLAVEFPPAESSTRLDNLIASELKNSVIINVSSDYSARPKSGELLFIPSNEHVNISSNEIKKQVLQNNIITTGTFINEYGERINIG